ncbi:deoxynucleotide monophosphate kinase family protein [Achromobacter aegrifaciens]
MNLIGIAAKAQSGKSTVAEFIKAADGYTELSFASPIREFVAGLLGCTVPDLEPIKEDVIPWCGKSPRQLMQTLGTEWGRKMVSETFWIDQAMQRVQREWGRGRMVVISDVRFENEAEAIRKAGGCILHLSRPDGARTVAQHLSEAGIERKPGDYFIVNDGTLRQLELTVCHWHYGVWDGNVHPEYVV